MATTANSLDSAGSIHVAIESAAWGGLEKATSSESTRTPDIPRRAPRELIEKISILGLATLSAFQ
jgi:hypothetical protein